MDYAAAIGLCWLVFLASWMVFAMVFGGGGRRRQTPGAIGVRLVILGTMFVGVFYGDRIRIQPFGPYALEFAKAGVALAYVGLAFAIWARVTLGRSWGMPMSLHDNPELVTSGPYRFVRHPIYTGLSAMLIGTALVYPLAVVPCVAMIAYSLFSSVREERDMQNRFGDAYLEYKKRSKRLVPFLL